MRQRELIDKISRLVKFGLPEEAIDTYESATLVRMIQSASGQAGIVLECVMDDVGLPISLLKLSPGDLGRIIGPIPSGRLTLANCLPLMEHEANAAAPLKSPRKKNEHVRPSKRAASADSSTMRIPSTCELGPPAKSEVDDEVPPRAAETSAMEPAEPAETKPTYAGASPEPSQEVAAGGLPDESSETPISMHEMLQDDKPATESQPSPTSHAPMSPPSTSQVNDALHEGATAEHGEEATGTSTEAEVQKTADALPGTSLGLLNMIARASAPRRAPTEFSSSAADLHRPSRFTQPSDWKRQPLADSPYLRITPSLSTPSQQRQVPQRRPARLPPLDRSVAKVSNHSAKAKSVPAGERTSMEELLMKIVAKDHNPLPNRRPLGDKISKNSLKKRKQDSRELDEFIDFECKQMRMGK